MQPAHLVGDGLVTRLQFEGTAEIPQGGGEVVHPLVRLAEADAGKEMLRIGGKGTAEHIGGQFRLLHFQHQFAHQIVSLDQAGIVLEEIAQVGEGFDVAGLVDHALDLVQVCV